MQITTKFNVGDSVVFLHNNTFTRREISKITVEVASYTPTAIVLYFFKNLTRDNYGSETYKYENEIAKTKEELAALMEES